MPDDFDHMRRIAGAAVAYLHACGCAARRDAVGEHAVLLAMVAAMVDQPLAEGDDDAR